MINGNILHSLSSGRLGVEHVEPIEALRLKVNNAPLPPGGVDYFIAGVKDLKKLDWRARRLYMESLKRWHTFQPIQMYIYYGVNPFTRAAVSLAAPFMPFRLGIADDLESALEIVENHKKNRQKGSPRAAGTAPTEEPYDAVLMNEYVDDLLDFIGRIDWEADGIGPFQGTDPLHPLTPVYEAIALVKEELDDLFRERERAESALRESEERFREILNHSRDILFKRNLETGGYEYISRAVTDIFGYTLEESGAMRFHGFVDRFHPDDKERYLQFMNTFLSAESDDETDHTVEYRLKGKDGAYRWLRNSHALVRDSAGRPRFIIGNSRDITEWKKTENALKEHHEMFLTIMDSIDAHIYVADMETFEILFMNKRMKDDLGRDLVGEPCWRALRGREGVCEECANRELLDDDGRPIDSLSREEKNPITGRWYIKKGRAIQWVDGRHVRLEIAADITRIKQLEKSRRQAEELRRHTRKLEAVGTMAEGIAHNFNNLLMAVMGNLDLVLLDLPPDSPFEDNLKSAEEAAGKAAELSTLMMTYIGQGAVRKKAIDLTEMVWEMKTSLEEGAPANAVLKFNLSPTPTPLKGDPDQIRQVILNLFTNASEAVQETGGEITLATGVRFYDQAWFSRQLLKKEAPAGEYVFFEAADTGPGMDAETIEKVSDPFFTTKFTGRGLGMAAVAGIVRGHKGAISLESEPGEGAIVRALFPALQERLPGAAPKKIDAPAETLRGSGTVLLVDDEEIVLTVGKAMLEKLGFHV
ncbi:MAG: PAS domain S-box protein, partial [Desulfobacterales bacterium]|nr:PAS domain S-box protein [Desulfobacterales bacterium]